MKIRGRRRCTACGRQWSYFETGSPSCPDCGSLRSVGLDDDRTRHTDNPGSLDLSTARSMATDRSIRNAAAAAEDAAREYVFSCGFIHGGTLRPLDDVFVATAELRHAAAALRRSLDVTANTERYVLALLRGADRGERPEDIPEGMRSARGLAAAEAARAYRTDLGTWLEDHPDTAARRVLDRVRDHEKRLDALDGDVDPATADRLVAAVRDVGVYLREGDESALARTRDRLDRLDEPASLDS